MKVQHNVVFVTDSRIRVQQTVREQLFMIIRLLSVIVFPAFVALREHAQNPPRLIAQQSAATLRRHEGINQTPPNLPLRGCDERGAESIWTT